MAHWNSSPHPISDIRDWSEVQRLELRPDFQRRTVWSAAARIMLMDTILRGVPMPKIFLANTIQNGRTYRIVIDGQQRISAILDFLRDKFSLDEPYTGSKKGKRFSELDRETQNRFLSYQIDFNEAVNLSDGEVREVYVRVNKYTVPLNKQELRRADFPGDFLKVSEELAVSEYFDTIGIFTPADRRRYADVEYVSELLSAMIDDIQDKKTKLDEFYMKYAKWDESHKKEIEERFSGVLRELSLIFDDSFDISKTRFRQKADFYSLFLVIDKLVSEGRTFEKKKIEPLQDDLRMLQENIRPESDVGICREYAIKCVSQANSASSRRWRYNFLKPVLAGIARKPDMVGAKVFYDLKESLSLGDLYCPDPVFVCPVCEREISGDFSHCVLAWRRGTTAYQITDAEWIHFSCVEGKSDWVVLERPYVEGKSDWVILERPNDDQLTLL